jgi:hypothetical protein
MENLSLLKTIEELPPNQKSSRVGQAGVIEELRQLPLDKAVIGLKQKRTGLTSILIKKWAFRFYH